MEHDGDNISALLKKLLNEQAREQYPEQFEELELRIASLEAALAAKPAIETMIEEMWVEGQFRLILAKRSNGVWFATWANDAICETAQGIEPWEAMDKARMKARNPTIVRGPSGPVRTGAAKPPISKEELFGDMK